MGIYKFGQVAQGTLIVFPLQTGETSLVNAAMFVVMHHRALSQFIELQLPQISAGEILLQISAAPGAPPFLTRGSLPEAPQRGMDTVSEKTG